MSCLLFNLNCCALSLSLLHLLACCGCSREQDWRETLAISVWKISRSDSQISHQSMFGSWLLVVQQMRCAFSGQQESLLFFLTVPLSLTRPLLTHYTHTQPIPTWCSNVIEWTQFEVFTFFLTSPDWLHVKLFLSHLPKHPIKHTGHCAIFTYFTWRPLAIVSHTRPTAIKRNAILLALRKIRSIFNAFVWREIQNSMPLSARD